jgi:hypothetical protein
MPSLRSWNTSAERIPSIKTFFQQSITGCWKSFFSGSQAIRLRFAILHETKPEFFLYFSSICPCDGVFVMLQ